MYLFHLKNVILTGTPLSRRLLPRPLDPKPRPPPGNSLLPAAGPKARSRIEVRSEPTLSCSLAMKSPSGASTSSSSGSFGSKLFRLCWRLEAGGPRLARAEGRIIGSLKSFDGRRSGNATYAISKSVALIHLNWHKQV